MKRIIQAGVFKAQCLKIMDDVKSKNYCVIITKRTVPIAKLVPINEDNHTSLFGKMKGTAHLKDDLIKPTGEQWNACS